MLVNPRKCSITVHCITNILQPITTLSFSSIKPLLQCLGLLTQRVPSNIHIWYSKELEQSFAAKTIQSQVGEHCILVGYFDGAIRGFYC